MHIIKQGRTEKMRGRYETLKANIDWRRPEFVEFRNADGTSASGRGVNGITLFMRLAFA
jgi:hypothetical protein